MDESRTVVWLLLVIAGYLLGSVLFCQWLPMFLRHVDVCAESEDGNPGAANVFVHCGWRMGLFCLFLDMAKGYLPVFIAVKWLDARSWWMPAVMLAPVAGQAWSCLHHFSGGKCIAVAFGELLALMWVTPVGLILAGLFILFSTALKIEPHRRRSLTAFGIFLPLAAVLEWRLRQIPVAVGCVVIAIVALIKIALDQGMKRKVFAPKRADR